MLVHELSAAECTDVLTRGHLGHLACARHGQPYVVPVLFDFDPEEGSLYSFATRGQKIDWMRANPKVCVAVDEIRDQFRWRTVLVFGRFEELDGSSASQSALRRAQALFERRPQWWQPGAAKVDGGPPHDAAVFYRIRIDTMTGRCAARPESGRADE